MKWLLSLGVGGVVIGLSFVVAMLTGWVLNIIALFHMGDAPITVMVVLRAIGIFLMPLGGVLGYF